MILIKEIGLIHLPNKKYRLKAGIYSCPVCHEQSTLSISKVNTQNPTMCRKCYINTKMTKHAMYGTPLYKVWSSMLGRCNNRYNNAYENYGGRGIKVCKEWEDFTNFYKWAIYANYTNNLSIDRIDNNGNYTPANCRWATSEVQGRNTRININNTSGYRGVTYHYHRDKWQASIRVHPNRIHLGTFKTSIEAAKAYNDYIIKNNLEHTLNIIPEQNK